MESQIVKSATWIPKLMKSPDFKAVSMAEAYRRIAERTGLDFNATIKLMEFFPIFVEGDSHQKIREFMAKRVAASSRLQAERLQNELTSIFHTVVCPPNKVDIVSQIAKPLWRVIASSIWAVENSAFDLAYDVPLLLCPTLALKERLELNRRIESFRSKDGFEESDFIQLCLAAAGARTFVGSMCFLYMERF
jgi:hypothetical protein